MAYEQYAAQAVNNPYANYAGAYGQYADARTPAPILRFGSGKPAAPEPNISPAWNGAQYTQPALTFGDLDLFGGESYLSDVFTGAFPLSGTPVSSWDGAYPVVGSTGLASGPQIYAVEQDGASGMLDVMRGLAASIMDSLGIQGDTQSEFVPVSLGYQEQGGLNGTTLMMVGGAAALLFFVMKKG